MARIVLLSCTKAKLDKPAPAQDLYSPSPMFQKTKAYCESLKPDKTFILSAKLVISHLLISFVVALTNSPGKSSLIDSSSLSLAKLFKCIIT